MKKGEAKKGYGERKGDTEKKNKNALLSGKNSVFILKTKKGRNQQKNQENKQTKKGWFRAK